MVTQSTHLSKDFYPQLVSNPQRSEIQHPLCCVNCYTFFTPSLSGTIRFPYVWMSHKFHVRHLHCLWVELSSTVPLSFAWLSRKVLFFALWFIYDPFLLLCCVDWHTSYVIHYAIWYHLHNLKHVKNTHGGMLILVKLQAKACNFTKINTPPWVFFTFFKLFKWYQIAQRITYFPSFATRTFHLWLLFWAFLYPFSYFSLMYLMEKLLFSS